MEPTNVATKYLLDSCQKSFKKIHSVRAQNIWWSISADRSSWLCQMLLLCLLAGCWWCRPACGRRAAWATVGWRQAAAAGTSPASVCFQATSVTAAPSRPPRSRRHRLHRHRSSPPLRPRSPLELIAPLPSAGPIRETPVRVSPVRSFSSVNYLIETKGIWIEWNVLFILIIFLFVTYIYICEYLFFNVIKHQSVLGAVFSLFRNKMYFINVICAAAYRRDLKHKNVKNKKFTINHPSMQIQAICKWSLWWWVHLNRPHALPAWLGNYFRESQRLCSRYALVKKHSNGGLGRLVKSACFSCQAHSWNLSCLISCFFCISNWPRVENNSFCKDIYGHLISHVFQVDRVFQFLDLLHPSILWRRANQNHLHIGRLGWVSMFSI